MSLAVALKATVKPTQNFVASATTELNRRYATKTRSRFRGLKATANFMQSLRDAVNHSTVVFTLALDFSKSSWLFEIAAI